MLRRRGHRVHEYLGRSPLRCDLAISEANGEQFSLGALLDGDAAAAANAGERYIFRPTVLRSFGCKIIDVLSHDWLRAPEDVLNRIEALLRGEEAPLLPEPVAVPTIEVEAPPSSEALPLMREGTFDEGSSNKF